MEKPPALRPLNDDFLIQGLVKRCQDTAVIRDLLRIIRQLLLDISNGTFFHLSS